MDRLGLVLSDRDVDGVVEMMLDATQNYKDAAYSKNVYLHGMLRCFLPGIAV